MYYADYQIEGVLPCPIRKKHVVISTICGVLHRWMGTVRHQSRPSAGKLAQSSYKQPDDATHAE